MNVYDRFKKYIPDGEQILAVIKSEPVFGAINGYYCATERRFAELWKDGLFSWSYRSGEWELFSRVEIEEGIIGCSLIFTLAKRNKNNEPITMKIPDIPKEAGRRFVAIVSQCIDENREIVAYRTKICPDCAETIKWNAKKCKYCSYIFD